MDAHTQTAFVHLHVARSEEDLIVNVEDIGSIEGVTYGCQVRSRSSAARPASADLNWQEDQHAAFGSHVRFRGHKADDARLVQQTPSQIKELIREAQQRATIIIFEEVPREVGA